VVEVLTFVVAADIFISNNLNILSLITPRVLTRLVVVFNRMALLGQPWDLLNNRTYPKE
jgi:hypothetical protein